MQDEDFMREALELARNAEGRTSPNPMVGAVIVQGAASSPRVGTARPARRTRRFTRCAWQVSSRKVRRST